MSYLSVAIGMICTILSYDDTPKFYKLLGFTAVLALLCIADEVREVRKSNEAARKRSGVSR